MFKIYFGCALTHAPEEFKQKVRELKGKLRALPGVEVLEFVGEKPGTPHEVYVHDIIECVGCCDLMVAICDFPSIGLGWEMGTQVARGKPLLAFGHVGSKITRLILDPQLPIYRFYRYETLDEIVGKVKEELVNLLAA